MPEVVSKYMAANRLVCLSEEQAAQLMIHCSPFGVIPKKNKLNIWRLIVDLSSPTGGCVNDGISRELSSLSYTLVDVVVEHILTLGRGFMLARMDIKQAYRMIPVHPQDRPLLGMKWQGQVFVDKALPFGLRSAPMIFSAAADALLWLMRQKGASVIEHYIDDFITAGKRNARETLRQCTRYVMRQETPVEQEKSEGPSTKIIFLGLELDSLAMEIRLPTQKLTLLKQSLGEWRSKKACRKRELLSLIGLLSHACKAVKAGRSFLRRLINLSTQTSTMFGSTGPLAQIWSGGSGL